MAHHEVVITYTDSGEVKHPVRNAKQLTQLGAELSTDTTIAKVHVRIDENLDARDVVAAIRNAGHTATAARALGWTFESKNAGD